MRRHALWVTVALLIPVASARTAHADDGPYKNVVGAISDTYGTFQAVEFVATLFGIGNSTEVQDAVTELEGFMQAYRDQGLVNNVMRDLGVFRTISSDYENGLTDGLEVEFINDSLGDLAQLQGDIQTGTMEDAYLLAPAFNLLTVTYVAALKAFGIENPANAYPDDYLNSFFDTAMAVDYALVGAVMVKYDIETFGGSLFMIGTQGGKTMWPKYADSLGFFSEPQYDATFDCDFTLPQNVDSDSFQTCFIDGENEPFALSSFPIALQDATHIVDTNRGQFQADPAVQAVGAAMNGLLILQHNIVTDWNTNPSFPVGTGHILISL